MKLFTKYMTRNDCYTAGRKITPRNHGTFDGCAGCNGG